ncbi:hypothetical protein [Alicyclobacillus fodiniaquatilis]|uniref:Uncharacterized protein n=1 Tax=Alicyclobacillus fodiniaquatilis TaxID=1661150 RepID=A0ABW4JPV2_9BACL
MASQPLHPVWGTGLRALRRSQYAQQVFTSVIAEWQSVQGDERAAEISPLIAQVNESSVYRDLAIGHCIRLHFTPSEKTDCDELMMGLVRALYQARRTDKVVEKKLLQLQTDARSYQAWLELALVWQQQRKIWLKKAGQSLMKAIPERLWQAGKRGA